MRVGSEKRFPARTWVRGASLLLIAALWANFALSLPAVRAVRLNDFPAYFQAGRVMREGHPEQLYSTDWKWFTNVPIVAALFAPLGGLEYETAWATLWWVSVASFVLTFALLLFAVARWFPPLDPGRAALVTLIFFAFAPVMRRCLVLGQTTPLLVLAFCGVYLLVRAGWPRSGGALLGLICVVKIPPMLLLPLLGVRRRWSVALPALAVVAAGFVGSWLFFGSDLMAQYADRVIWENLGRAHAAFNNQSLDGALMRMLSDRGLADWVPVARPAALRWISFAILAALAALLLVFGRRLLWPPVPPHDADPRAGSLELEIGLGVALMVLVFPIVWIHYYLFLVVPLALLPFWWQARAGGEPHALGAPWMLALPFAAGAWLAGGMEAHENAWYAAREGEMLVRLRQNLQPLGALLLIVSFLRPLHVVAERQRSAATGRGPAGAGDGPSRDAA